MYSTKIAIRYEIPGEVKSRTADSGLTAKQMGPKYVKKPYRDRWTPERPTTGYCYIVAEVVYHYLAPMGSKPHVVKMNEDEKHWYIVLPDGKVVDLTSNQYDGAVPYDKGRPHAFRTPRREESWPSS